MKVSKIHKRRFAICGLVSLTFANSPAHADPFAILFGDPPKSVVSGDEAGRAHEDNIRLLSVSLRDQPLIDIVTAYEIEDDVCVEITPIFEALNFPVSVTNGVLQGWLQDTSEILNLDLELGEGVISGRPVAFQSDEIQKTDTDWCVSLRGLTRLTNIDFNYQASTLSITATPRTILPIEAKLERARLRESALVEVEKTRPSYSKIVTPYKWVSMPTADIVLDASATRSGGAKHSVSFDVAGDFLKMTGHARTVSNSTTGMSKTRFTLSRVSEQADQLGPLKARRFSLGDISAPSQPLIERSESGFGAIISNAAQHKPTLFDTTDIRGPLPIGWEAELYQNERLIAFTDEPDSNGDYVFLNVDLTLGYNRVVVKLYGPYGEFETRVMSQFVGGEQCPDGELRYTLGVLAPRMPEKKMNTFDTAQNSVNAEDTEVTSAYFLTTAEYGLTKFLSARLDATHEYEDGKSKAALSVLGSSKSVYGGVRMATGGEGLSAVEAFAQTRIGKRTSLSAKWVNYGDFVSDLSGEGENRIQSAGVLRLDSQLGAAFRNMPIQARMEWQERSNGDAALSVQSIMSSQYKGARWSHALKYSHTNTAGRIQNSQIDGDFIASKTVKNIRMRGGLNYTFDGKAQVNTVSISAQRKLKRDMLFQASAVYDMKADAMGAEAVVSKSFKAVNASFRTGLSQNGDWHTGLNLAFALYSPKDKIGYRLSPPGLSRTGAVRLHAFEDLNGDGRFSEGEMPTENVKYIVGNNLRSETSSANGEAFMTGLESHISTDIELQISSLDDPFLRPVRLGRAVSVRPGQVVDIPFPLLTTGDVDGVVSFSKDGHDTPLAGVEIEAVDGDGVVHGTAQSEYDGYFYMDGIPATDLILRVAQDDLNRVGGQSVPQPLTLNKAEPSKSDVKLVIQKFA